MKNTLVILIFSFCFFAFATEIKVKDGDTFSEDGITYRIWGIDTPECGQPWADVAESALRSLLKNKDFITESKHIKSYDREVVLVKIGNIDVGLLLLKMGLAWHDSNSTPEGSDYENAMNEAKNKKIGIWSDENPIPPWKYRKQVASKEILTKENKAPKQEQWQIDLCIQLELLLQFKDKSDFHLYGFGVGGPYNQWMKQSEFLQKTYKNNNKLSVIASELIQVGMDYVKSSGKDTSYTRSIIPEIMEDINFSEYLNGKTPLQWGSEKQSQ